MMDMQQRQQQSLRQYLAHRLFTLLWSKDVEASELVVMLCTLGWGVWLVNPSWDSFSSTPTFRSMQAIAPEWVWGTPMLVLSLVHLVGLLADHSRIRKACTFANTLLWVFLSAMVWQGNLASTASVVYPVLALASLWAWLRLARFDWLRGHKDGRR